MPTCMLYRDIVLKVLALTDQQHYALLHTQVADICTMFF
jgi:hypothetical protein